jgi:hypothetical protein
MVIVPQGSRSYPKLRLPTHLLALRYSMYVLHVDWLCPRTGSKGNSMTAMWSPMGHSCLSSSDWKPEWKTFSTHQKTLDSMVLWFGRLENTRPSKFSTFDREVAMSIPDYLSTSSRHFSARETTLSARAWAKKPNYTAQVWHKPWSSGLRVKDPNIPPQIVGKISPKVSGESTMEIWTEQCSSTGNC